MKTKILILSMQEICQICKNTSVEFQPSTELNTSEVKEGIENEDYRAAAQIRNNVSSESMEFIVQDDLGQVYDWSRTKNAKHLI